jgi:hypothetical protein
MTAAWRLLLLVPLVVVDARAQDEVPYEEAAEEMPAEEATIETTPLEAEPVEEAEAEPEEEGEPWALYVGADLVTTTVSTASGDVDSGMYRLRLGRRIADGIGAELHYGFDNGGDGAGEVSTDSYYGIFIVPTATALETVELAFPVGYARSEHSSHSLSSLAYGFNAELPLRNFGEDLPDLRFGLGWMVYAQKGAGRTYGPNLGIRYDFTAAGFGNPLAGVGDFLAGLWPFGDDDEDE